MIKRRILGVAAVFSLSISLLCGCGQTNAEKEAEAAKQAIEEVREEIKNNTIFDSDSNIFKFHNEMVTLQEITAGINNQYVNDGAMADKFFELEEELELFNLHYDSMLEAYAAAESEIESHGEELQLYAERFVKYIKMYKEDYVDKDMATTKEALEVIREAGKAYFEWSPLVR